MSYQVELKMFKESAFWSSSLLQNRGCNYRQKCVQAKGKKISFVFAQTNFHDFNSLSPNSNNFSAARGGKEVCHEVLFTHVLFVCVWVCEWERQSACGWVWVSVGECGWVWVNVCECVWVCVNVCECKGKISACVCIRMREFLCGIKPWLAIVSFTRAWNN